MSRIIEPIGDKIIIPKRKIKKSPYRMWMGLEDHFPPRVLYPRLSKMSILTPGSPPSTSPSSGLSEISPSATDHGDTLNVGNAATNYYIGNVIKLDAAYTISRIVFWCEAIVGNIGSPLKTYYAKVYRLSDDGQEGNLSTLLGTSDGVSGATMSAGNPITFDFSTPATANPVNTWFAVVIYGSGETYPDPENCLRAAQSVADNIPLWGKERYSSDGTAQYSANTYELYMILYD